MDHLSNSAAVYRIIKRRPASAQEIFEELQKQSFSNQKHAVSKRSVYRYLKRLEDFVLSEDEVLSHQLDRHGRKVYFIQNKIVVQDIKVSEYIDMINWMIINDPISASSHSVFFSKLRDLVFKTLHPKIQMLLPEDFPEVLSPTRFGEVFLNDVNKESLFEFVKCIHQNGIICVREYTELVVQNNQIPEVGKYLKPLRILFSRGAHIFLLSELDNSEYYALEIDMVKKWSVILDREIGNKRELNEGSYSEFLNFKFGHHNSIVPGIHKVVLKFPPNPGNHVRNRHWHSTQFFTILENQFVLMSMRVEINVELIGWIMMWMDNVQVIEPSILKDMVLEKLKTMKSIHEHKMDPRNNG